MTLIVVLVLAASLVWLGWEGWQWRCRVTEARQAGSAFSVEVAQRVLRQEVDQFRVLLAAQQQQLATLEEEVAQLRKMLSGAWSSGAGQRETDANVAQKLDQATFTQPPLHPTKEVTSVTTVSPEYAEPLALARRGLDPEALVARCGVTMAEAQLICALAQSSAP